MFTPFSFAMIFFASGIASWSLPGRSLYLYVNTLPDEIIEMSGSVGIGKKTPDPKPRFRHQQIRRASVHGMPLKGHVHIARTKMNGTGHELPEKGDSPEKSSGIDMAALPDLFLILLPSALWYVSGTAECKVKNELGVDFAVSRNVLVVTGVAAAMSFVIWGTSKNIDGLSVFASLVYSAVFPYTVSMGGTGETTHFNQLDLITACLTILLYACNWTLPTLSALIAPVMFVEEGLYVPTLLFLATFHAVSHTAKTSFNFEEVSLIICGIYHALIYAAYSPTLVSHEIFLPALTFGMMLAIAPAVPLLRRIKSSSDPNKLTLSSFAIVVCTILGVVRPWLVAKLGEDPTLWVLKYMISSEGYKMRLLIVVWWLVVLAFGIFVPVRFFSADEGDNGESLNKRRKFFHGIVVLLFLPALSLDVTLTLQLDDDLLLESFHVNWHVLGDIFILACRGGSTLSCSAYWCTTGEFLFDFHG
jgi:hypothetical protein